MLGKIVFVNVIAPYIAGARGKHPPAIVRAGESIASPLLHPTSTTRRLVAHSLPRPHLQVFNKYARLTSSKSMTTSKYLEQLPS